jgi:hypothetical protein
MPELLARLQSALADRYRIDSEIGAGGAVQSTLFGVQNVFQRLRYDRNRQR